MHFHIILVEPARAENVGAAARAMKTMGFNSLRIVNSEAHLQPQARWLAHGAGDILEQAEHFSSLSAALHDVDFTIATTARSRAKYRYYCSPVELVEQLREKQSWLKNIALVFGREESGLSNDDLELADLLTGIPMGNSYPSLNLGQSVMVYCYQLADLISGTSSLSEPESDGNQLYALRQRAQNLFKSLDIEDEQKLSDWLNQRLGFLGRRDIAMLHTLLGDIEKKFSVDK